MSRRSSSAQLPSLYFSVSATTRAPRHGEVDGVHYHFLSMEQFEKWIEEDQFLEHAQFVGNRYGTHGSESMDNGVPSCIGPVPYPDNQTAAIFFA